MFKLLRIEVIAMNDYVYLGYNKDDENLIGSAFVDEDGKIIVTDEVLYTFVGIAHVFDFKDYLHHEYRQGFVDSLKTCTKTPKTIISKLRRNDGVYVDISIVMYLKTVCGKVGVVLDMYEIEYMALNYKNNYLAYKEYLTRGRLSDEMFIEYIVDPGELYLRKARDDWYCGTVDGLRQKVRDEGIVADASEPQFEQLCDALKRASSGYYEINSTWLNKEGEKGFNPTSVVISTIVAHTEVEKVVGLIKRGGGSLSEYAEKRVNLDPLTNLLNKRATKEYAMEALENAKKDGSLVTFVMIDLDNFKSINDTYGHMFGDETLVNVARIMKEAVGDRGEVGRIGGDEFFLVLKGFADNDAAIRPVLRGIRSNVAMYFRNKLDDMNVTCSVGTATFPKDADNYDDLFKLADHCVYVAKSMGRNRYIIYREDLLGTLDEIKKNVTVIQVENYVSEDDKSEHLRSVIRRCNEAAPNDKEIVKTIMREVKNCYGVSAVQYCPADGGDSYVEISDFEIQSPRRPMELRDAFTKRIREKGALAIGNYDNFKREYPELWEYLCKNEIYSFLLLDDRDENYRLRGVYTYSVRKRYLTWSAFDIKMLKIIGTVLDRFLK